MSPAQTAFVPELLLRHLQRHTRQSEVTRTGVAEIVEAKIAAFHMPRLEGFGTGAAKRAWLDRAEAPRGGIDGVPALRRAQPRGRQVLQ